ncbi:MAG: hypothetical protein HYU03_00980 [Thaumarchaeota archaeon]|nr:hypothetical protein [Nitrososphaerota archaeon]MCS4539252.1 hypothetical protein [Nitrososphaerota archaeon]
MKTSNIAVGLSILVFFLLAPLYPHAYAHPDFRIVNEILEVPAGRFVEYPLSVHFHRVVGAFEVISPINGVITILIMDDPSYAIYASDKQVSPLYSSSKINKGTLNFLVPCCKEPRSEPGVMLEEAPGGFAGAYNRYHLVVDNANSSANARIMLRVTLIHDGPGVVLHDGEPFATVQLGGFFGIVGFMMGMHMWRSIRRSPSTVESQANRKVMLASVRCVAIFAASTLIGFTMAVLGARSYGGSLVDGLVASLAGIQLPPNPFVGSELILLPITLIPWILALIIWVKGFRTAAKTGSLTLGSIGVVMGAMSLAVGLLFTLNYFSAPFSLLPFVMGGIFGALFVIGGLYLVRKFRKAEGDLLLTRGGHRG